MNHVFPAATTDADDAIVHQIKGLEGIVAVRQLGPPDTRWTLPVTVVCLKPLAVQWSTGDYGMTCPVLDWKEQRLLLGRFSLLPQWGGVRQSENPVAEYLPTEDDGIPTFPLSW